MIFTIDLVGWLCIYLLSFNLLKFYFFITFFNYEIFTTLWDTFPRNKINLRKLSFDNFISILDVNVTSSKHRRRQRRLTNALGNHTEISSSCMWFVENSISDNVYANSCSRRTEYGTEPNGSRITNLISQKCGIVEIAATKPLFTTNV